MNIEEDFTSYDYMRHVDENFHVEKDIVEQYGTIFYRFVIPEDKSVAERAYANDELFREAIDVSAQYGRFPDTPSEFMEQHRAQMLYAPKEEIDGSSANYNERNRYSYESFREKNDTPSIDKGKNETESTNSEEEENTVTERKFIVTYYVLNLAKNIMSIISSILSLLAEYLIVEISDEENETTIDKLKEQYTDGEISIEEYEERVEDELDESEQKI